METTLYNQEAQSVGTVKLPASLFGVPIQGDLLHQVVTSQLANQRKPVAHTKGRGEVRGGGKKPWQQKGTGRARHGSIRSPIWKGGGVTFGPTNEKDYSRKINKKAARKALAMALSSKVTDSQLLMVDAISIPDHKTKAMASVINRFAAVMTAANPKKRRPKILFVVPTHADVDLLGRSTQNLASVEMIEARNMNALIAMNYPYVLMLKDAIEVLEKTFIQ